MQYGHFDDAAREYVITEPQTPSPWINYLGSEAFFTLMSNTSGGYSFYKDARMLRLTRYRYNNVPTDAGGQYFYINDGGVVWTRALCGETRWIAMSAATAWATPASRVRRTGLRRWKPRWCRAA